MQTKDFLEVRMRRISCYCGSYTEQFKRTWWSE